MPLLRPPPRSPLPLSPWPRAPGGDDNPPRPRPAARPPEATRRRPAALCSELPRGPPRSRRPSHPRLSVSRTKRGSPSAYRHRVGHVQPGRPVRAVAPPTSAGRLGRGPLGLSGRQRVEQRFLPQAGFHVRLDTRAAPRQTSRPRTVPRLPLVDVARALRRALPKALFVYNDLPRPWRQEITPFAARTSVARRCRVGSSSWRWAIPPTPRPRCRGMFSFPNAPYRDSDVRGISHGCQGLRSSSVRPRAWPASGSKPRTPPTWPRPRPPSGSSPCAARRAPP